MPDIKYNTPKALVCRYRLIKAVYVVNGLGQQVSKSITQNVSRNSIMINSENIKRKATEKIHHSTANRINN